MLSQLAREDRVYMGKLQDEAGCHVQSRLEFSDAVNAANLQNIIETPVGICLYQFKHALRNDFSLCHASGLIEVVIVPPA